MWIIKSLKILNVKLHEKYIYIIFNQYEFSTFRFLSMLMSYLLIMLNQLCLIATWIDWLSLYMKTSVYIAAVTMNIFKVLF